MRIIKKLAELQNEILNKFGIDKLLHLFGGAIIFQSVALACVSISIGFWVTILLGFVVTLVIAFGKEFVYDKWMRKTKFDLKDAIATILGVPFSLLTIFLLWITLLLIKTFFTW